MTKTKKARFVELGGGIVVNLQAVGSIQRTGKQGAIVTLLNGRQLAVLGDELEQLTAAMNQASDQKLRQELKESERERASALELASALRRKVQRQQADIARLTRQLAQVQAAAPAGEQVNG